MGWVASLDAGFEFVPTSILAAHLARLLDERREQFVAAVVAGVHLPLDYVRLNVSGICGMVKVGRSRGAAWGDGYVNRTERECGNIGAMSNPRTAPYGSVRLANVDTLAQVDPGNPNINEGAFHLIRRHFDVQAFGVNAATGNAGDEMIEEHHEADDEENQTNGHQELFAVMTGHALFTVDGEEIDAPAGTIVFVRDPALLRAARATADDTTIFVVGGPASVPYTISRWEAPLP